MALTFVHAADLHLDSPLRALRAEGPLAGVLREATFGAFTAIVDLCLRERAQLLLLAGDLFDARDRSVRARLALRRELARLDQAGVRTFIVHGNHDPLTEGLAGISLPRSVHVFGPAWEEVVVERDGAPLCRVQGISYGEEAVRDNLSRRFGRHGPEFTVGLLHANIGGDPGHANYAPCTLEDLSARGLDYWALGHVHTRAEYPLSSGGVAVYPGNPQGRHVNECGERGCVVATVEGRVVTRRFVPVDRVRWHRLEVDIAGLEDPGTLVDRVQEAVDGPCGPPQLAHAVRVTLVGRGPLHAELATPEGLAGVEEELARTLAARGPPVVLESVEPRTRPMLDVAALVQSGGLLAELVEAGLGARERPAAADALWVEEELRSLDQKLQRLGVRPTREQAVPLVERAVDRALELLVDGA